MRDPVNQIREAQVERKRYHAKQEVAPWHRYARNRYLNHHQSRIQGMEADVIPSYGESQYFGEWRDIFERVRTIQWAIKSSGISEDCPVYYRNEGRWRGLN